MHFHIDFLMDVFRRSGPTEAGRGCGEGRIDPAPSGAAETTGAGAGETGTAGAALQVCYISLMIPQSHNAAHNVSRLMI